MFVTQVQTLEWMIAGIVVGFVAGAIWSPRAKVIVTAEEQKIKGIVKEEVGDVKGVVSKIKKDI